MSEGCYLLELDQSATIQTEGHSSFIGGKPRLPAGTSLPRCRFCDAALAFYFQVAFPEDHCWGGLSLAIFSGVDCAHREYTIPPMLDAPLKGAQIPAGFLEEYQGNFRLFVFETSSARLVQDYQERVKFVPWRLIPSDETRAYVNRLGGEPAWILGDEEPASYGSSAMRFLMQITEDFEFKILEGAPRMKPVFDLTGYQPPPFYDLFNANALYFFGTEDRDHPAVYIITQID